MSTYLYHYSKRLSEAELRELLVEWQGELTWIYIETETQLLLWWTKEILAKNPTTLGFTGRIFGNIGEIRWQWQVDGYEIVCVSEGNMGAAWEADSLEFDPVDVGNDRRRAILIGRLGYDSTPENPLWREARYPYPMVYPVKAESERVYIECQDYRVKAVVVMSRLCCVSGDDGCP